MLRALLSRFRRPPAIELVGELFEPKPGQVLVLRTRTQLAARQRDAIRQQLLRKFGSTIRILVVAGDGELSLEPAKGCAGQPPEHR